MAFRQDTDKSSMMTAAGGWDVLDPVIAGQQAPSTAQPTPANEGLETHASGEAEPALQRDEEAVTGPYSNSSAGSFDDWSTQQRRQEAAEKSGFAIANQGPTNQETEEDREQKKDDNANDALAEMVQLGREERKREWEKQVVKLGNLSFTNKQIADISHGLNDEQTYDAFEAEMIRRLGPVEGRRQAKLTREYAKLVETEGQRPLTPEEAARKEDIIRSQGEQNLGRNLQIASDEIDSRKKLLGRDVVSRDLENGFQTSSATRRDVLDAQEGFVAAPTTIKSIGNADPLTANPIQARNMGAEFAAAASGATTTNESKPTALAMQGNQRVAAKVDITGLAV